MKSKDILNAIGGIDPDMVEDTNGRPNAPRSLSWLKRSALAACLCLSVLTAVAVPFLLGQSDPPHTPSMFWVDDRERKSDKVMASEYGIEFAWRYCAVFQQYNNLNFEGVSYSARVYTGQPIPTERIGEKLGSAVATGYDNINAEKHETDCEIYRIAGVDPLRLVAVKYNGRDDYYPFLSDHLPLYKTLGDWISALDLTETVALDHFYPVAVDGPYGLLPQDSAVLWQTILKYADAPSQTGTPSAPGRRLMSFALSSHVLGVENLSLSITEDGYLTTNIEPCGVYFRIGTEAVREIEEYVLAHKTESAKARQFLVGVVTEIGDGYIKVDDSIMMKDPDDGMVFTVYTDHYRIKPYIVSGYVKVGETVRIIHERLSKEDPTQIRSATDISEAIITGDGDVLIPE